ncbi:MAG: hypothetical protein KKA58_05765 [Nanoarchaeota archaeon]|nr:hypothetical protein [Nanoarchaeota archaeon]MBU1876595.1 hypothetical protein [Nanoarchaeota archaeon]
MKKSKEIEDLSSLLGFEKTFFLDEDFVLLEEDNKKELLKKINNCRKKIVVYKAKSEEMLRFALERTSVDIVFGMELINPKDSVHFVRGSLDQILCKIAASKGKIVGFSFNDILNARDRAKLLGRMILNIKLCKKYGVKMLFSSFSVSKMEMRSANDLEAFFRIFGKN